MNFFNPIKVPHEDLEKRICYSPESHSDLILDVIKTLPIHIKLILFACLRLHDQDRKNIKITVDDVVFEYQRLANESRISSLHINKVVETIKELEMLGYLKCRHIRKGSGQIKYISIYQPAEIPKFISVLKEELRKVKVEDIVN